MAKLYRILPCVGFGALAFDGRKLVTLLKRFEGPAFWALPKLLLAAEDLVGENILELNLFKWDEALPILGVNFFEPPDPWITPEAGIFLAVASKDEVEGALLIEANAAKLAVVWDRSTEVDIA